MANIINISGLTKKFGDFTAVDNISLDVREGEIFGFLGPNGAGKTTTISMLTTLIRPTAGNAKIGGYDLISDSVHVRSIIGVVPQTFALFPELTALENLSYIGKLYGLKPARIRERSESLLKSVSLFEHRNRIASVFSGGMKQRLSLCASIMSDPKILFMDEPTTGLDPQSRIAMRELTKKLNSEGMTIVYTTHDMEEAEKICDRINIMDKGRIVANGTSAQLKAMVQKEKKMKIIVEQPSKVLRGELSRLPFISSITEDKGAIVVTVRDEKRAFYKLSDFFKKRDQEVSEICYSEPSLEDVFIHLTKKNLRD